MAPKSEAEKHLEKAEKKAASSTGWFSSSSSKWEDAGDLFQQAANAFKLEKQFKEAGDAFSKEAECREKSDDGNSAANAWWNAAKVYRLAEQYDLAIQAFLQAIAFLCKAGRFRQAADREKDIAQIYLQNLDNRKEAVNSWIQAADWYEQEDASATASQCRKDAADLQAELGEYSEAIRNYESVADKSLLSALTKYSVKKYWLRACLCALASKDTITAKRNLSKYEGLDVTFASTREAKFVRVLVDAIEDGHVEGFTGAVVEYDQVMKLDNWETGILLKIKNAMQQEDSIL